MHTTVCADAPERGHARRGTGVCRDPPARPPPADTLPSLETPALTLRRTDSGKHRCAEPAAPQASPCSHERHAQGYPSRGLQPHMRADTCHAHPQRHMSKNTLRETTQGRWPVGDVHAPETSSGRAHAHTATHPQAPLPAIPDSALRAPPSPHRANPIHQASEASQPAAREGKGVSVPPPRPHPPGPAPPTPRAREVWDARVSTAHDRTEMGHMKGTWGGLQPARHTDPGPPGKAPTPPCPPHWWLATPGLSSLSGCQARQVGGPGCVVRSSLGLAPPLDQTCEGADEKGGLGSWEYLKGGGCREAGGTEGVRTFTWGHQSCRRSPRYNAGTASSPCHCGSLQGDRGGLGPHPRNHKPAPSPPGRSLPPPPQHPPVGKGRGGVG